MNDMTMPNNDPASKENEEASSLIDGFDGIVLHPSVDIKNNVLVLGFRYRSKERKDENVVLVVTEKNITVTHEDYVEVEGQNLLFDMDDRQLARLEERWSVADLNQFVTDYNSGKTGSVPEPRALMDSITTLVKKYVQLEREEDYTITAAWCIGTYFFPTFSAFPFLNPKAPKKSGKSQFLNTLQRLCFNASKSRPSLAALGDTVDAKRGTYLIDQAELLWRKENGDLEDIIADSYKRSGGKRSIVVIGKDKRRVTKEYDVYSPKAIASTKELKDDLRDRFIIVPLIRSDKNFPDPDDDGDDWQKVRGELYKFLICNFKLVELLYSVRKSEYRLNNNMVGRKLELWLPLETIMTQMGVESGLIDAARKRFLSQYGFSEDEPTEVEAAVIRTLMELLSGASDDMILFPKAIAEKVDPQVFSPADDSKQRASQVGWALKKFNLHTEKLTRTKDGYPYLFEKERVEKIYRQYFSTEESPTPPTSPTDDPFAPAMKMMQDAGLLTK